MPPTRADVRKAHSHLPTRMGARRVSSDAANTLISLHSRVQVRLREVESQYVANRAKITDARDLIEHVRQFKRRELLTRAQTESERRQQSEASQQDRTI